MHAIKQQQLQGRQKANEVDNEQTTSSAASLLLVLARVLDRAFSGGRALNLHRRDILVIYTLKKGQLMPATNARVISNHGRRSATIEQ